MKEYYFTEGQKTQLKSMIEEILETKLFFILNSIDERKKALLDIDYANKHKLTQKEASEYFSITKQTIIRWEKKGIIAGERKGKYKIYYKMDFENLFYKYRPNTFRINEANRNSRYNEDIRRKVDEANNQRYL